MSRNARSGAGTPPTRKIVPNPSATTVPPVGAVGHDKIKAVELDPRSNGENDWQDEMPAKKTNPPATS